MDLAERLESVRRRIQAACQRCGRHPSSVTLIAVTKGVTPEAIKEAVSLRVTDLGENRVQEAREKQIALGSGLRAAGPEPRAPSPEPIRWHLIGHLQRNKAKDAVELFDLIHSVDSVELVDELERHVAQQALGKPEPKTLELLVQVNVSGEATKFGCRPDAAYGLAEAIFRCPHLRWSGLMTLAPFSDNPEDARPHFRRLRELRDHLQQELSSRPLGHSVTWPLRLSMGMSQDFDIAIEEGADFIRVGTAIFGART